MTDAEKIYPLVPSALEVARRRAHEETRAAVRCAVMEHAEATPGLADAVADGAVQGVADALDRMPLTRRGQRR